MNRTPGVQTYIKCPFFLAFGSGAAAKDARSIICESPVRSAKSISLFFFSNARLNAQLLWCCNEQDGGGCPIYKANMEKYEKEDQS